MPERFEVYLCEKCGNIVEIIKGGGSEIHCCGQPMKKLEPKTADPNTEKHVPSIEKKCRKFTISVGKKESHPMSDDHFIEWIEIIAEDGIPTQARYFLKPGEEPVAEFRVETNKAVIRSYCNKHGLWKNTYENKK